MRKIASPRDLTVELQRLMDYAGESMPSRTRLASSLYELADRVAVKAPIKVGDMVTVTANGKQYHGTVVLIFNDYAARNHPLRVKVKVDELGGVRQFSLSQVKVVLGEQ